MNAQKRKRMAIAASATLVTMTVTLALAVGTARPIIAKPMTKDRIDCSEPSGDS
jgi:hypothetical protein